MKGPIDFLWLLIRCIGFIWLITTLIILVLFMIGSEAEGLTLSEQLTTAFRYAGYVGGIFGTLLAIYVWWQTWKIKRRNKKMLARREKTQS